MKTPLQKCVFTIAVGFALCLFGCAPPLYQATKKGDLEKVKTLLGNGADVSQTAGSTGETSLHCAARLGHGEVLRLLASKCKNINPRDSRGFTPLHVAAENGHRECVELLIDNGTSVDVTADRGGKEPDLVSAAVRGGLTGVFLEGVSAAAAKDEYHRLYHQLTPLHLAAQNYHPEVVEILLARGANVNAKDYYGRTPLWYASYNLIYAAIGLKPVEPCAKTIQVLLDNGADPNIKVGNFAQFVKTDNLTPLSLTLMSWGMAKYKEEYKEIMRMFLDKGANPNEGNQLQGTPLISVVDSSYTEKYNEQCKEMILLLLEHGADINAKRIWDATALHRAAQTGNKEIAKLLLDHGANPNAKTTFGATPMRYAKNKEIKELLRQYGGK